MQLDGDDGDDDTAALYAHYSIRSLLYAAS